MCYNVNKGRRIVLRLKIKQKLTLYFFVLIIISLLLVSTINSVLTTNSLEQQAMTYTEEVLSQVQRNIDLYIKNMEDVIWLISNNDQVLGSLKQRNTGKGTIESQLGKYKKKYPEIAGILIISKDYQVYSNDMSPLKRDFLTKEPWYIKAKAEPSTYQMFSAQVGRNIKLHGNYSADEVVSISKAIYDPLTKEYLGVILIDLRSKVIKEVIDSVSFGKKGFVYVTDITGSKVYAPVNPIVYRIKQKWILSESSGFVRNIKEGRYQIIHSYSEKTKWFIVGVFSLDETLKSVSKIQSYTIIICLVVLALAASIALFFATSIAKPVARLQVLMKKAEEGDMDVRFELERDDEIGDLGKSFNAMIGEIKNLIELVYQEQQDKRDAELKMLQSQINPHFLYNTLDTIQWMALENDVDEIVDIIESLTKLFRIGLSKGKDLIPLGQEIQHVTSYLAIQQVRYEDRMTYRVDIDEDIMGVMVPKLILQPLVENSIYHGIKGKSGRGEIVISGKKLHEGVLLEVRDDGAGIKRGKLAEIREGLSHNIFENKVGYGMFNVNERLVLLYGKEHHLIVESVEGEGAKISIYVPDNPWLSKSQRGAENV